MATVKTLSSLLLLSLLLFAGAQDALTASPDSSAPSPDPSTPQSSSSGSTDGDHERVDVACNQTIYNEVCLSALGPMLSTESLSLPEIAVLLTKECLKNATGMYSHIQELLKHEQDLSLQQGLSDCADQYGDAVDQLEDAVAGFDKKDYSDVALWISAAMSDSQTCEQGFSDEPGKKSPLTHRNTVFYKLCSNALTMTKRIR